jgi:hypothetical protein
MFQTYSWRALRMVLSHLAKSYILLSSGYVNYVIQIKLNDIIQQKCNILYMFSTTLPPPFSAKFVVFCIVVFHQYFFLLAITDIPQFQTYSCHYTAMRTIYGFWLLNPLVSSNLLYQYIATSNICNYLDASTLTIQVAMLQ